MLLFSGNSQPRHPNILLWLTWSYRQSSAPICWTLDVAENRTPPTAPRRVIRPAKNATPISKHAKLYTPSKICLKQKKHDNRNVPKHSNSDFLNIFLRVWTLHSPVTACGLSQSKLMQYIACHKRGARSAYIKNWKRNRCAMKMLTESQAGKAPVYTQLQIATRRHGRGAQRSRSHPHWFLQAKGTDSNE